MPSQRTGLQPVMSTRRTHPSPRSASQAAAIRFGARASHASYTTSASSSRSSSPDPAAAQQHRRVPVEVRRREERRDGSSTSAVLSASEPTPEDDDVVVPLPVSGSTASGRGLRKNTKLLRAHLVDDLAALAPFDAGHAAASACTSSTVARVMAPSVGTRPNLRSPLPLRPHGRPRPLPPLAAGRSRPVAGRARRSADSTDAVTAATLQGRAARARSTWSWSAAASPAWWPPPGRPAAAGRCCWSRPATGSAAGCSTTSSARAATIESGGAFVGPTQDHILRLARELEVPHLRRVHRRQQRLHLLDHRAAGVPGHRPAGPDDPPRRRGAADPDRPVWPPRSPSTRPWTHPQAAEWDAMTLGEWIRAQRDQRRRRREPDPLLDPARLRRRPRASSRSSTRSGTSRARATSATSAPSPATPTPSTARRSGASSAARS